MNEITTLAADDIEVVRLAPAGEAEFNCADADPCDPVGRCCDCDPSDPCF
jgi:hypothetical protein